MPFIRFRAPRRRAARIGAALLVPLVLTTPAAAHQIQGWWKYDPAFWRHDFREHEELRLVHRRWHAGHGRPKHAGRRLQRWTRRHATLHHLRLDHPHQVVHHHEASARQRGKASWYDLEGAMGSCGQRLHGMYAAHPTWPCGTLVSVRTADRYVFVQVIDRGPHGDGRVIDLAKRAFERLAPASEGVRDVKIYRLEGS
jgi:rare lipoprotein A (peptidoglycan hydrolase)